MEAAINAMEAIMHYFVEICIICMETFGAIVLIFTGVRGFMQWMSHSTAVRLDLAQGIALALEFKMGGEVLRTVITREKSELFILGAIILLRGVLTFLIHWEIKNEEQALEKTGERANQKTNE